MAKEIVEIEPDAGRGDQAADIAPIIIVGKDPSDLARRR